MARGRVTRGGCAPKGKYVNFEDGKPEQGRAEGRDG